MSGIAGIYHRFGPPVVIDQVRRMTDAAAHRGMDDAGYWVSGAVGLGHRMFHTTPESLYERQPLTDETGQLCLTFDGRVDNREDLRRELEADGFWMRSDTDAEIVLRAYQCWGETCALKIIGDFALAIWDGRKRQLYCARDFFGIRPFNYFLNDRTFVFASELHQLFEHESVPQRPNEGMIGEMLCGDVWSVEETLWQGILRLPPAHFLIVTSHSVRKERYWQIDPSRQIRYRRDEEYAEHCREVIAEAVRCRLRSHGPIAADLSGGLDSSSVVSMAQHLIKSGDAIVSGFKTFSWVFPGQACDESKFIREVIEHWNLDAHTLVPSTTPPDLYIDRVLRVLDFPGYPNSTAGNVYQELMRQDGYRVQLTGEGGDEWFQGINEPVIETFKQFKLVSVLQALRNQDDATTLFRWMVGTMRVKLRSHLPRAFLQAWRQLRAKRATVPSHIAPEFARRIQFLARTQEIEDWPQFTDYAQSLLYGSLRLPGSQYLFEIGERDAVAAGIESRHPLEDRRVVEFGFALPDTQRQRNGVNKFVLRQAMRGLLPTKVEQRTDKAEFSNVFFDCYRATLQSGADIGRIGIRQGWLVASKVQQMRNQLNRILTQGTNEFWIHIWTLWAIHGIELWWSECATSHNSSGGTYRPVAQTSLCKKQPAECR